MDMRKTVLLIVLSVLSIWEAAAVRFVTRPYLQNLKTDEVTVMWIADDANGMRGWVEYSADGMRWNTAYQRDRGLISAYERINRVRITGLESGTQYQYRVGEVAIKNVTDTSLVYGDTIYSAIYRFTTIAKNAPTVSCKIFNDLHDNHTLFEMLMGLNILPNYDFVFFNGDMLNMTPSEMNIQTNLLTPCIRLFASEKPFATVRGNHEVRREFARKYFDYFQLGDKNMGYYTFEWGPCYFIVLDCGEDAEDSDPDNLFAFDAYRDAETAWLAEVLQSEACQKATYRVVMQHIPTYPNTSKERHGMLYAREHWQPLFHQYGVDVVIAGHTHKPGIYPADNDHHYPLVIGGGNDTSTGSAYPPTMTTLEASQYAMTIKIYNLSGKVLHSIVIENKEHLPALSGELDVLRIGDGTQSLDANTAHPLFVDRYTLKDRAAVLSSTIAIPVTSAGENRACLGVASAMLSNYLMRSDDKGYLLIGGYATDVNDKPVNRTAEAVPRVAATVDWNGNINTTTAITSSDMDGQELRYVLSPNGHDFTLMTASDVMTTTLGAHTARVVEQEIPTMAYTLVLNDGNEVRYAITGANEITKYSLVDGEWMMTGVFGDVARPHQLVARQSEDCIQIFVISAISAAAGSSRMLLIEDLGGYNAPISGLVTELVNVSGENKALRGINFCPQQPSTAVQGATGQTSNRRHTFSIENGQIIIDNMYNALGQKIR